MSRRQEHHRQHGGGSAGSNRSIAAAEDLDLFELGSNAENALQLDRLAAPDRSLLQQAGYSGTAMELPFHAQLEAKFGMSLADIQAEMAIVMQCSSLEPMLLLLKLVSFPLPIRHSSKSSTR